MFTQQLFPSGYVFWDCSGGGQPHHIVEGRVLALNQQVVLVERVRTWTPTPEGFVTQDVPPGLQPLQMRRSYLTVPVEQRFQESRDFWTRLAAAGGRA